MENLPFAIGLLFGLTTFLTVGLFYLAESLYLTKRLPEALPYYERLLQEFEKSEFLAAAQKRVAELKATPETALADSR